MKNFAVFCLFLLSCLPALAVENGQVMYLGGTAPGVNVGVVGRLDTTAEAALIFEYSATRWKSLTPRSSRSSTRKK